MKIIIQQITAELVEKITKKLCHIKFLILMLLPPRF